MCSLISSDDAIDSLIKLDIDFFEFTGSYPARCINVAVEEESPDGGSPEVVGDRVLSAVDLFWAAHGLDKPSLYRDCNTDAFANFTTTIATRFGDVQATCMVVDTDMMTSMVKEAPAIAEAGSTRSNSSRGHILADIKSVGAMVDEYRSTAQFFDAWTNVKPIEPRQLIASSALTADALKLFRIPIEFDGSLPFYDKSKSIVGN